MKTNHCRVVTEVDQESGMERPVWLCSPEPDKLESCQFYSPLTPDDTICAHSGPDSKSCRCRAAQEDLRRGMLEILNALR